LEEARLLDKRSKMSDASDRYGQAAEMFRVILEKPAAGQSKREIGLIIILANAWRAMSRAEAEASPELYEEAARLFEEAKEASPGERAKNLTLGHSRFCKALGLGARFADESDPDLHHAATNHLESAARYYTKAGYDTAAEYARASKLLFDAYAQMSVAGKEADPQKKAKSFAMTEKLLEASADSYGKVGQSGRKEQVLKMLDRAKREKLLAISLTEVFLAPDEASSTSTFSSPSLTQESAVGLDRFEHADVQATLIARPKTMNVGQELVLEVELVNAGRGPAQLTKIDKVIPEGFDVVSEPEKCRVEDSYVNMKGRRLNALKTDDVKLVLRPSVHGEFQLRPRIMYLDESGKYKWCEPEPVEIRVKELGISGWLKGPERKGR
jgi:tetratricopeptide (TPR) repeat protein